MSTETTKNRVLTRGDIRALRTFDDYTIRHGWIDNYLPRITDEGRIECISASKSRHYIYGESKLVIYKNEFDSTREYYCFAGSPFDDAIRTLAALAKPGDSIKFRWLMGNDNDYMRKAEITRDQCELILVKPNGKSHSILVAESITPEDCIVRLVRSRSK